MIKCIDDHKNLDNYQFLAIYGGIFRHPKPMNNHQDYSTKDRIENVIKAIMCIIVQVAGVILILYEFIKNNDRSSCNLKWSFLDFIYKLLALCLSARISYEGFSLFFIWKGIHKMQHYPNNREFSLFFAWTGFIINKLVALCAIIGGWLIIFFAETAFSMILSSLALVGLMELDDKLLHSGHYKQLKHKVSEHKDYGFNDKECKLFDKKPAERYPISYWSLAFLCFVASFYVCICY